MKQKSGVKSQKKVHFDDSTKENLKRETKMDEEDYLGVKKEKLVSRALKKGRQKRAWTLFEDFFCKLAHVDIKYSVKGHNKYY